MGHRCGCLWRSQPQGLCIPCAFQQRARQRPAGSVLTQVPSPSPFLPAVSKCIQLSITCTDTAALTLLRDRINKVLLKAAGAGGAAAGAAGAAAGGGGKPCAGGKAAAAGHNRRPLAPRSLNTLAGVAPAASTWGGGSVISLRSGLGGGGPAPSASGFSLGATSRQQLASSADSEATGGGEEDLAALSEEQQRALQLVRSGRSIFFTGWWVDLAMWLLHWHAWKWGHAAPPALSPTGQRCRSSRSSCLPVPAVSPPHVPLPPLRPAGCAGTGKSLLLRHILQSLPRDTTFVTGTTGLAACHLGGTTINSFAGIGRAEGSIGGWLGSVGCTTTIPIATQLQR